MDILKTNKHKIKNKMTYTSITSLINSKLRAVEVIRDSNCLNGQKVGVMTEKYTRKLLSDGNLDKTPEDFDSVAGKDEKTQFNTICFRKALCVVSALAAKFKKTDLVNAASSNNIMYDYKTKICGIPDFIIEESDAVYIIELKTTLNSIETHNSTYESNTERKYNISVCEKSKHILQLLWYMETYKSHTKKEIRGSIWHIVGKGQFELQQYDLKTEDIPKYKNALYTMTRNSNLYIKMTYEMIEPYIRYTHNTKLSYPTRQLDMEILMVDNRRITLPAYYSPYDGCIYVYVIIDIDKIHRMICDTFNFNEREIDLGHLFDMVYTRISSTLCGVKLSTE